MSVVLPPPSPQIETPQSKGPEWMSHLKRIESAAAISALAVAMLQFMQIDPGMFGFALVWTAPPLIAMLAVASGRLSRGVGAALTAYLFLVAIGSWIGPNHRLFPGLGGEHPGGTDFAYKWNRLDLTSRRLIAWNMGVTAIAFWVGFPYVYFFRDLQHRWHGRPAKFSSATCWFGLIAFWGTLLLALTVLVGMLF